MPSIEEVKQEIDGRLDDVELKVRAKLESLLVASDSVYDTLQKSKKFFWGQIAVDVIRKRLVRLSVYLSATTAGAIKLVYVIFGIKFGKMIGAFFTLIKKYNHPNLLCLSFE